MKFFLAVVACALGSMTCTPPAATMDKQIVGAVELVRLYPDQVLLEAKLDTGAEVCSLDAANITRFSRNGEDWVRFDLYDQAGKKITRERKLVRESWIKRHISGPQKRPVIRLILCLGRIYQETEVNLVDRTGFKYPLLIGRRFMQGRVLIDPALKHTVQPNCGEQSISE